MAAGIFTITELLRYGATRTEAETGDIFRWTNDRLSTKVGGARAAPMRPWTMGGQLRTSRTDYPGARTPSEQVLGPHHVPFTLSGRFDDRYNFPGYAVKEQRRFEALCRRGNPVRIQFQNQAFECLITEWSFDYHRAWYIQYSFTVSVHDRPDQLDRSDRSPPKTKSPQEAADQLGLVTITMLENIGIAPKFLLASQIVVETNARIGTLTDTRDGIGATLDSREFAVDTNTQSPFARLATQFRTAARTATDLLQDLAEVRSDVDLGAKTVGGVLDFEDWSRTLRFQSRALLGLGRQAAQDLEERNEPDALAVYRPAAGESLYAISRRFYGTPFAWRLIADHNNLSSVTLTGDELLVIPERGLS